MKKAFFLLFLLTTAIFSIAQTKHRRLEAVRTFEKIIIDGNLTDAAWKSAPVVTDFVELRPQFGLHETENTRTEIKILYDNNAIYVSGFCHENSKDSIATELVGRDAIGVNDYVGVLFDTYDDKINGFGYYVTPLGEQFDAKYSSTGEDASWSSVYYSVSKIVDSGWTFEMRIPYSAIRFSNKTVQNWGINFIRRRNKTGKQLFWNPVDPKLNGLFTQAGVWAGIKNIKPPVRLSFSPYLSSYANHYPYNQPGVKNWSTSVTGGMDVKYGISQSFTLDMTLVPDFGQVQSDNHILNLTPFEVKYNENRTFFTEGTDLFSKGNLFYSRRIGGTPLHAGDVYNQLGSNDSVVTNPTETKLINATKISGRTASGLGIGVLNAITNTTYATIETGDHLFRQVQTSPLTNYNILVLDQALKHNSSISLVNTNVWRSGSDYDANVTAGLWDLYDKKIEYEFGGKVAISQLMGYTASKGNLDGYSHNVNFGKMAGNFNFNLGQSIADEKYQQNDMGYFTNNNYFNHTLWLGYKLLTPKSFYNNLYMNINAEYDRRFNPTTYQNVFVNVNINGQLKNLWNAGIAFNTSTYQNDFYEPRIAGQTFKRPSYIRPEVWLNTNSAKKYSVSADVSYTDVPEFKEKGFDLQFNQQFRFNNKLTISNTLNLEYKNHEVGFAALQTDSSIFGMRVRHTVENIFNVKYNFNNKMGISFRARHYWSKVDYSQFYNLESDGGLKSFTDISSNPNSNVNFFNIDMVYTWQFAQGSFINIVWKDATSTFDTNIQKRYFQNFTDTWSEPQSNSLSFRIIYYLDYLSIKRRK